jgi:hypothetical protein
MIFYIYIAEGEVGVKEFCLTETESLEALPLGHISCPAATLGK